LGIRDPVKCAAEAYGRTGVCRARHVGELIRAEAWEGHGAYKVLTADASPSA
jgi:hypothetical protein